MPGLEVFEGYILAEFATIFITEFNRPESRSWLFGTPAADTSLTFKAVQHIAAADERCVSVLQDRPFRRTIRS